MNFKVSVTILAYNHQEFIDDAIEGALMQKTDFPFEIVIGEDCSTDRTREIVIEHQKRHPDKIRLLLHEHNIGASKNADATLNQAKAPYVAYLDGDDYWTSPDKLQTQADFLDRHPESSMCFHDVVTRRSDGRSLRLTQNIRDKFYTIEDLFWRNFIPSGATMFRRELFNSYDWVYPKNITGDRIRYIWLAQFGTVGYIDKVMGVYRIHDGGIYGHLDRIKRQQFTIDTIQFANKKLNYKYDRLVSRKLSRRYLLMSYFHLSKGDVVESGRFLRKSVQTYLSSYSPLDEPNKLARGSDLAE